MSDTEAEGDGMTTNADAFTRSRRLIAAADGSTYATACVLAFLIGYFVAYGTPVTLLFIVIVATVYVRGIRATDEYELRTNFLSQVDDVLLDIAYSLAQIQGRAP